MEFSVTAGTALAVIQKSNPPVQREGIVAAVKGATLAIGFAAPVQWSETDEIVLIARSAATRFRATGRFVASGGDVYAFALITPWQPLNLRSSPRHQADLHVRVTSVLGQSRQDGRVLDVSLGGMAVWVPAKPGGGAIDVTVAADGFAAKLRCEVLATVPSEPGVVLRVRYDELNAVQQAFVRKLVATAAAMPLKAPAEDIEELAS